MAQSDDDAAFSDAEIVGNALTMLLAGEDTTANSLAWMMHLMVEHPDVQVKMQQEADDVLGDAVRPPDYARTQALRYIEAVAHETMRLLPVAPLQGAEPNEDTLIGGVRVPKGTAIYLLAAHAATAAGEFLRSALIPATTLARCTSRRQQRPQYPRLCAFRCGTAILPGAPSRDARDQDGCCDAVPQLRGRAISRRTSARGSVFVHDDAERAIRYATTAATYDSVTPVTLSQACVRAGKFNARRHGDA